MTQSQNTAGFSLFEVLVAISLLGMASVVILGAMVDARSREIDWKKRQLAARVGVNAIQLWSHLRQSEGIEKGGYRWTISLQPYNDLDDGQTLQTVNVLATVSWQEGTRLMSLSHCEARLIRGGS